MAFSPSLPADNSKVRNFPSEIRDNFTAIDNGDDSFAPDRLNLSVQGSNPTLLDNAIILYSKDSSSESALYAKNDADDVIQMTDQEYIGGASQKMKAVSIRFGTGTIDNNQNAMCTAWGRFNTSGGTVAAYNCTAARTSTGFFTITFDTAMANANYSVVVHSMATATLDEFTTLASVRKYSTNAPTTTAFKIKIVDTPNYSPINAEFSIMVFGGV